jgi:hypothetical protein
LEEKLLTESKGGIKSHSVINADEKVPNLVWFSPATTHDHQFLENSNAMRIPFIYSIRDIMITRLLNILPSKNRFCYSNKRECKVRSNSKNLILETIHSGVLSDEIIQVEVDKGSMKTKLKLRK